MLDEHNVLAESFRMVRDRFKDDGHNNVRLRLIRKRCSDGRTYNLPTVLEVAALVVRDFELSRGDKDIVIETQSGLLQRINELNPAYLGLPYPLLFPYGEDEFREDIAYTHTLSSRTTRNQGLEEDEYSMKKGREHVTVRDYFSYKIQERKDEISIIVFSKRLLQQFLVDAYTMVESSRLKYIRLHQKKLRAEMYKGLTYAILVGETNPASIGKRIILSSSFTGRARYMVQNYQDVMAICRWAGYPDLFITFTCNPKWLEISKFVDSRDLNPEDRPDILYRIFKVKLDHLIKDLWDKKILVKSN